MSRSPTLSEQMAAYFAGSGFRQMAGESLTGIAPYALDTLVCTLGGTTSLSSRKVVRALLPAGSGPSVVFGTGRTAPASDAALINGAAAHALELDDDHRVSVMHPGAVVVPAAFALAQAAGSSGADFLRAVLAGYEVAIRAGEAFRGGLYRNGFHPTAVCGVFGAAAAGAVLLDLDEAGFVRAMGIAGTQSSGSMEWRTDGSWIKRLHPGRAAQSGVIAALLAREGFTAPSTIFEGEYGVFAALSHRGYVDASVMVEGLGQTFKALGTAIKPFPCCRFSHGTIDLALQARKEGFDAHPDSILVRIYRTDVLTYHRRPLNAVDAQFNIPYLLATALLTGNVGLSDFTDEAVARPDILELASKVTVVEDQGYNAAYPQAYLTDLEMTFADGRSRRWHSDCPSGDPEAAIYRDDPAALVREVHAKARSVLAECGFGERADGLIDAVNALPAAPDVSSVAALLFHSPHSAGQDPSSNETELTHVA